MAEIERSTLDAALVRCTEIDRIRDHFNRYFFGNKATQPAEYDLVVNTGRVPLEDVIAVVATAIRDDQANAMGSLEQRRVMTLARELGAGERGFASAVADRLDIRVYDRELLERQAVRLGVPESELEKIDEQPPGIFQRFRPGNTYQRYRDALDQFMHEVAAQGSVILVGRGGSRFLRSDPAAFHVRLVAPMPVRVRRVMEYHWVREDVAKKRIVESDARRCRFFETCFGTDWSSPLEYDITVNTGRLGLTAVNLVVWASNRRWSRSR
jgi:cytidylate kinase